MNINYVPSTVKYISRAATRPSKCIVNTSLSNTLRAEGALAITSMTIVWIATTVS